MVRPVDKVLVMTALKYEAEVAHADTLREELEPATVTKEELKLTKTLLEAFEKPKFSLEDYKDHYVEELTKLIEAKVEGREVVAPPSREEPHVINLMDALKKSVAVAKRGPAAEESAARKPRKVSKGGRPPRIVKRRRKTG
jgi:DNA end-binding protein Ku